MTDKNQDREDGVSNTKFRRRTFLGVGVALLDAANPGVLWFKSGWWQPKLKIVVDGPFADEKAVSLKDYRSSFVEPRSLRVAMRDTRTAKVQLGFTFKGKESSSRRISVDIRLHNAEGKIVGTDHITCSDRRIGANKPVLNGTVYMLSLPNNSETVKIPLSEPSNIKSVELLFRPA
ncbi:MAG: hypothetical protein ABFC77_02730 [Thermoguttaceae bacterium]